MGTTKMPEKDPATYSLLTYAWVSIIAMWGGAAGYIRKIKEGHTKVFSFAEFVGELVTAGFFGVITFWLCEAAEFNPLVTAALVGISGHMGSRFLFVINLLLNKKFNLKVSVESPNEKPNDD